ncbi:MAG: helix-turn-helix transcriptional regulator [Atopobiaceae bacterium]|nr:helix-turn-helix transcriptional regulator [Atopobiaceae bacterium]
MPFSKSVFAENMRRRRVVLDMSQAELAERAGVTPDLVWSYENEKYVPGADKACAIAEALGCTINDLCGWGDPGCGDAA